MTTFKISIHDPGSWKAEAAEGRGNWCYAAVTCVVRGSLRAQQLSQAEVAHNFYMKIHSLGGARIAGISGTRGTAIDNYARAIGLKVGDPPISFSDVPTGTDARKYLSEAWGAVDLNGLTESSINSFTADDSTEVRVCQTIDANGLVIVGTAMHCMVIYGYEIDVEDDRVEARRFYLWDPTDGSRKAVDLSDYEGSELTFVTS